MEDNRAHSLHPSLQALLKPAAALSEPVAEWSDWPSSDCGGAGTARAQAGRRGKIVIIARERLIRDCLVLLSHKAAGDRLKNQIVGAIHEPARGLRWAWLKTADRGLTLMSRGL